MQLVEYPLSASRQFLISAVPNTSEPLHGSLSTIPKQSIERTRIKMNSLGLFFEELATKPGSARTSPDKVINCLRLFFFLLNSELKTMGLRIYV